MNAHQEKMAEIKAEIERLTRVDFDCFGDLIRTPKPGKKKEVEALELRLRQAAEANEAFGRAVTMI